ncbi:cytidine deaminase [Acetobacter sp. AN02]|uniref:cytidine deaminase n=1 Tax=Acetobacter sp. AN02 TaxID=2894186 RepID=UPI002434228C|nr:cytidine deaminase [Acetobacter sp. AN02]MDG6094974.1 cytidine deaminase [Acetobacter sp. AN02]
MNDDPLIPEALRVRENAWAPYSGFQVGAALRCEDGRIFSGCNVENAAYPEGTCAEAGAIAAMIASGGRRITGIVVCGDSATPCTPCGGCRQKLREFSGPDLIIRMVSARSGEVVLTRTLAGLLPDSFGPDSLE